MPGTVGTLGAVLLYLFLSLVLKINFFWYGLVLIFLTWGSVWVCTQAAQYLNNKDPSCVVLDEGVGFLTSLFLLPFSWTLLILAFFFNRLFDIWKPFPIRRLEKLPGGWGIVLDDVMAGLYAHLVLRVFLYFHNVFLIR
ncbi:MAG: phosphatidylglycerophosphatase A [Chlamydiae bacterium]|nr:phosphatidylglycerophosphatase A [Chlamydiota bacterium]MBI3265755.1 phosphatidylglycerophosphatase A [Chlamydiota bacterium]